MKTFPTALVALSIGIFAPGVVRAQAPDAPRPASERRPYRGLFSGLSSPSSPQSLVLSGSLFGAYDDNLESALTEDSGDGDWRFGQSGFYGGAQAGLAYTLSKRAGRASVGLQSGANVRYYKSRDASSTVPDFQVGGHFSLPLTRSASLNAGHQLVYSRFHRFLFFPSAVETPTGATSVVVDDGFVTADPNLELFGVTALRNTTHVSLEQRLGRYASVGGGYNYSALTFLDDDPEETESRLIDYRAHSGFFQVSYRKPLTAHAGLNLGYHLRVSDGQVGTGRPRIFHDVTAGVDYSRALSFTRRTSFTFSSGSAFAVSEDASVPESEAQTHFRLTANAALRHEIGRTWTAHVAYFRGFNFREGFNEPFFTDGLSAGISGLITQRVSFSASGAWALSELQSAGGGGHTAFTGTAQATYALSEFLALFAGYVYYKYDFDPEVLLDPRFPRVVDRQGVRVGLSTSVPLIR